MKNNLERLLESEANEINNFFEKASIEGEGTPQEVSDRRESALTVFLKKYFPFPYRVTKGNIRDSYGNNSMSIDCIILNPKHPYTTTNEYQYSIILADGIDVAIELKPKLNSDYEIERSLEQITSVKKLRRVNSSGHRSILEKPRSNFYYETHKTIPSIIFSIETYKNEELLIEKIVSYYEKEKVDRIHQFDFIVVNNEFIIFNSKIDSYVHLKELGEGIYINDYKESTLSAFLLHLNILPQSEMRISNTVLEHYIKVKPNQVRSYTDLNERLLKITA